jgi:hypothetical protein
MACDHLTEFADTEQISARLNLTTPERVMAAANVGISAEAQHVLNSLEAHLAAVKAAAASGGERVIQAAEDAWEDVMASLKAWGVEFSGSSAAGAPPASAGSSAAAAAPAGK